MSLTREKLAQAADLIADSELDVWLTFVRETHGGSDPALPLILDGGLTWQSALVVSKAGKKVAVVGNYDAGPLESSGDWDKVVPYVQGIRETLLETLEDLIPEGKSPRIGVNFSKDDVKADGLTHGMFLLLCEMLEGTRFAGTLVSASSLVTSLRSIKTLEEVRRMRGAIAQTEELFKLVEDRASAGMTEREVFDLLQSEIGARGLGYAWDRAGDPIVNSGPDSMVGHGVPSDRITIAAGHILHIDLGVVFDGYASDVQRCWYVPHPEEVEPPEDAVRALEAVVGAIATGAECLRPDVQGWEVDAAARRFLVSQGYAEYQHALGHQVGRVAHDGGAILGPRWERYGRTPLEPIREGMVFTLELGVDVPGRGYLGIEEMVRVVRDGVEWLTRRQSTLPLLGR